MDKVIYDISVLGLGEKNPQVKTGVYRVVDTLLGELLKKKIILSFSHTEIFENIDGSLTYLKKNNISQKINYTKKLIKPFKSPIKYGHGILNKINKNLPTRDSNLISEKILNQNDIFHSTFYPIPDSIKKNKKIKRVITIYDLIPILFENYHVLNDLTTKTIQSIGSDYAICISEHTKRDLLAYDKNIKPENVFVSLLAASPENFYPCKDTQKFKEVKEKYQLPDKYFLSLSTLEPRKNIEHVIRTFVKFIKEKNINDLHLVLVGTKGWMFEKIFEEFENAEQLKEKIIITGRIPDEDLASVYSNAHSFYYMSLYEGFGLPPLEAMQCGVATVTSNTSSLPEVMGDAGIMHDPLDQEALLKTMWELYSKDSYREELQKKALEQSKKFSWEKCAQDHIEIYKKIIQDQS